MRAMLDSSTAGDHEGDMLASCDRYETLGPCGRVAVPDNGIRPQDRQPSDVAVFDFGDGLCSQSPEGVRLEG